MNVKLIAGLIFLVLLFVLGFGSELFVGAWRQTTPYKLEEPPEKMKDRLRSFRQEALYKGPPSRMGNTLADARFVAALNSMEIEQKQREDRTREKREIEKFMETNVGQYLSQGLEMLSKGRREEARSYIKHALSLHTELEYHIYVILLKTLLHSYVEEKDRKELDVVVLKYLETIRNSYDNAEFEKVVAEVTKKIEDKVRYGAH